MTKAQALAGEWLGNLAKIVLVWFIAIMSLEGARFDQLITQKALVALALSIATWLLLCVQSWQKTGSLEPVPAAHVEAIPGQLLSVESNIGPDVAAGIVAGFRELGWALVVEPAEALRTWHQGEAGSGDDSAQDEAGAKDTPYVPTPLPPDVPPAPVPVTA